MNENIIRIEEVTVNGKVVEAYKIESDANGNPRYVIHFLSLDVKPADYGKIKGLTKYRGKWFGGGYVVQSYNIQMDVRYMVDIANAFYALKV